MYKKAVFLADLLMTLSQQGSVFSFVPEYFMESMVDSFHSLRRAVPPLPFTSEFPYTQGLKKIITALVSFFIDSRIVNPGTLVHLHINSFIFRLIIVIDVKDLLLQSLGVLMQYPEYVAFVESLKTVTVTDGAPLQTAFVRGLLQAFDKKFWITVTSILLRFWKVCIIIIIYFYVVIENEIREMVWVKCHRLLHHPRCSAMYLQKLSHTICLFSTVFLIISSMC